MFFKKILYVFCLLLLCNLIFDVFISLKFSYAGVTRAEKNKILEQERSKLSSVPKREGMRDLKELELQALQDKLDDLIDGEEGLKAYQTSFDTYFKSDAQKIQREQEAASKGYEKYKALAGSKKCWSTTVSSWFGSIDAENECAEYIKNRDMFEKMLTEANSRYQEIEKDVEEHLEKISFLKTKIKDTQAKIKDTQRELGRFVSKEERRGLASSTGDRSRAGGGGDRSRRSDDSLSLDDSRRVADLRGRAQDARMMSSELLSDLMDHASNVQADKAKVKAKLTEISRALDKTYLGKYLEARDKQTEKAIQKAITSLSQQVSQKLEEISTRCQCKGAKAKKASVTPSSPLSSPSDSLSGMMIVPDPTTFVRDATASCPP